MRKVLLLIALVVVLLFVNFLIMDKEKVISKGFTVLLQLAPVDPRSLMQGDYLALRYAVSEEIRKSQLEKKGKIVVSLDKNSVAKFIRIHKGEPLAQGEYLLIYRNRKGLKIGAESFFFQEGDGDLYSEARYGELKVDQSGAGVLVGLCDKNFKPLGRKLKK